MTGTAPIAFATPEQLDQMVQYDADGRVAFGVGLRTTLYFADGYTPAVREGLLACIAEYLEQTAPTLVRCSLPKRRRWVPFAPEVADTLRDWVAGADADTPWSFVASGSVDDDVASPFHLEVLAAADWEYRVRQKLSYITATFPVSWFAGREERLPALMARWADRLAPQHGFGGLSFYFPPDHAAVAHTERMLYALSRRFLGAELDYPVVQLADLGTKLKGANWLTAVGDALLAELGGRAALEAQLPAGATVHPYPGGLIIQLGPAPQLGDTAAGIVPASYAALSRILRPVRVDPPTGWGVSAQSGYDREGTRALLARFDG